MQTFPILWPTGEEDEPRTTRLRRAPVDLRWRMINCRRSKTFSAMTWVFAAGEIGSA